VASITDDATAGGPTPEEDERPMRLECPECHARYEVADSAIPASGRTVQCGACGQTWFQHPVAEPEAMPTPAPADRDAVDGTVQQPAETRPDARSDDWDVEYEDIAADPAEDEKQPDGLPAYRTLYRKKPDARFSDPAHDEARTDPMRDAPAPGDATVVMPRPEADWITGPAPAPVAPLMRPSTGSLRALPLEGGPARPDSPADRSGTRYPEASAPDLPGGEDREAVASLLARNRAARESRLVPGDAVPRPAVATGPSLVPGQPNEAPVPPPGRSRFATGLSLALLVFLILLGVYALRAPLAEAVPDAAPYLEAYATRVDEARVALEQGWARLVAAITGTGTPEA
jgi:predicted Zn finger-like uncharacterized protein